MNKRIIALILTLGVACSLAGCNSKEASKNNGVNSKTQAEQKQEKNNSTTNKSKGLEFDNPMPIIELNQDKMTKNEERAEEYLSTVGMKVNSDSMVKLDKALVQKLMNEENEAFEKYMKNNNDNKKYSKQFVVTHPQEFVMEYFLHVAGENRSIATGSKRPQDKWGTVTDVGVEYYCEFQPINDRTKGEYHKVTIGLDQDMKTWKVIKDEIIPLK